MDTGASPAETEGIRERVTLWFLLEGNRFGVAGLIVAAVVAVVAALVGAELVAVGPRSSAATVFASGLVSGVVTLVTIAVSINQFILSRVFGTPDTLADRLEGTQDLRETVEELAGEPTSPNDPAAFLSMIGTTLQDRATTIEEALGDGPTDPPEEVTTVMENVRDYGESIDDNLEEQDDIVDVLDVVLGTEYAQNMTAVRHLRNAHGSELPRDARADLDGLADLFESIAVARQFFKTLSLQQDFARLSRIVVYTGLIALLTSISLALVYRTNTATIGAPWLAVVVTLGIGVIVSPFAAFVSYILRAATIARRTVSVGPFIPPEKR